MRARLSKISRARSTRLAQCWLALFSMVFPATLTWSGGPRWVAGSTYFVPSVLGQPIVWRNGSVHYYTDLGPLSASVDQAQANAMVAAAATLWSAIPTAAIQITLAGNLAEDVSGNNFFVAPSGLTMPPDVEASATGTPVGVIYDADGSVLNALYGEGASDPLACVTNGVTALVDNFATDATIAHALLIINGLCATNSSDIALLQYELLRGFGRILGLDWSQANDQMFPTNITSDGLLGWPLMHPVEKLCNSDGNPCMTGTIAPRPDDVAALNRLYPVTAANAQQFPGKYVTNSATISISGTVSFRGGQGMQGVNVVARPLIAATEQADLRYPTAAVTGSLFLGNAGNLILGFADPSGLPLDRFGTATVTDEGFYDLRGIPMSTGVSKADYQLTFESVNPLYTGGESVGPYGLGQVFPSGTMPVIILRGLSAGSHTIANETISDSSDDINSGDNSNEDSPQVLPPSGMWEARITGYGHAAWLRWHVRGGRQITIEAQPLNELGLQTETKARILIGVWNGDSPLQSSPNVGTAQPFNAVPSGLTTLTFETGNDGPVRMEFADQRGDGRPDFLYRGRVLSANTVSPLVIPISGGPILIEGTGFRSGTVVTIGGVVAEIISLRETEITAVAPPSPVGIIGSVDVTITDPLTKGWSTIESGSIGSLSYESDSVPNDGDAMDVIAAPRKCRRLHGCVVFCRSRHFSYWYFANRRNCY